MIVRRWKQRGYRVVSFLPTKGQATMLSNDQQGYLANPKTLTEMRSLSLEMRARLIKEKFALGSFTGRTLWNYYRRLGVRYTKPQYIYQAKASREREICEKQQEFALDIATKMMK